MDDVPLCTIDDGANLVTGAFEHEQSDASSDDVFTSSLSTGGDERAIDTFKTCSTSVC